MKKFFASAAVVFVFAATAFAGDSESPRLQRDREVRQVFGLKLVIDPGVEPGARPSNETLHYLVDRQAAKEGVVYGFSSVEARNKFADLRAAAQRETEPAGVAEAVCPDALFNKVAYGTGIDWLRMYCGQKNDHLSDSWNDVISYVEGGGSWTILYKCYYFNYSGSCSTLTVEGGTTRYDLHYDGFNNYASSIKVCPEGYTSSDCFYYY